MSSDGLFGSGAGILSSPTWLYDLVTLLVSYLILLSIVALAWNTTITTTLRGINGACEDVHGTAPASRAYAMALLIYAIARTLLLTVAGLTMLYFASQMLNILVEYMPDMGWLNNVMRCLACTQYTFLAVDPAATLSTHVTLIALSCIMVVAMTMFFITDHDLTLAPVMRRKLTYVLLVLPGFALSTYAVSMLIRMAGGAAAV